MLKIAFYCPRTYLANKVYNTVDINVSLINRFAHVFAHPVHVDIRHSAMWYSSHILFGPRNDMDLWAL